MNNDTADVIRLRELNQVLEDRVVERTGLLMRAKRTWEATFDAIVDPLAIVDEHYAIVRTNLAHAATAGADIRKISGRRCHEVLFSSPTPCAGCPAQETLSTGLAAEGEVVDSTNDRVFKVWSFRMRTHDTADEGARQVVCHYKDITEEKDLQAKLLQSEKMAAVGTLAGGVAHEINNPLGAIMAFSQLALQDLQPGSDVYDFVSEIERSAKRCKAIVASLLDFSRPSRGDRAPVSLAAIADKAVFLCSAQLRQSNISITCEHDDDVPPVLADKNQIEQVVLNLISNACQAMEGRGGKVTIRTFANENDAVKLTVSDTGPGIEPRYLDKIFEPFFTTKAEGKGTGLGLSISYSIVQDHGATMAVDSRLGQGTTFEISFGWPEQMTELEYAGSK